MSIVPKPGLRSLVVLVALAMSLPAHAACQQHPVRLALEDHSEQRAEFVGTQHHRRRIRRQILAATLL